MLGGNDATLKCSLTFQLKVCHSLGLAKNIIKCDMGGGGLRTKTTKCDRGKGSKLFDCLSDVLF